MAHKDPQLCGARASRPPVEDVRLLCTGVFVKFGGELRITPESDKYPLADYFLFCNPPSFELKSGRLLGGLPDLHCGAQRRSP